MKDRIIERIFGRSCTRCEAHGVNCQDSGMIDLGRPNDIYIDGRWAFRTRQRIKDCPVILGQISEEKMAGKLRETDFQARNTITISDVIGDRVF